MKTTYTLKIVLGWCGILLTLLLATMALPATAATVNVTGRVTQLDGTTPYPGAKVELMSVGATPGWWVSYAAYGFTDANGNYSVPVFSFGVANVHAFYRVRVSADGQFFTQPGQVDVVTANVGSVNSLHIGSFPQPGSRVLDNTPGLVTWLRIGDQNYYRNMITANAPNNSGLFIFSGKVAASVNFNGTTDFVNLNEPAIASPWTLSFWLLRSDAAGLSSALLSDATSAIKVEQYPNTRRLGFTRFGVADYAFNYSAPAGQWVHVTMTGTGNATQLYINGTLQDTINAAIPLPRLNLGRVNVNVDVFRGQLDELAIWNRALTSGEIFNLYSRSALDTISGRLQTPDGRGVSGVPIVLSMPPCAGTVDQIPYPIIPPTLVASVPNLNQASTDGPLWSGGPTDHLGAVYKGQIIFPTGTGGSFAGNQNISLTSDDGSRLYANGSMVINNDGLHAPATILAQSFLPLGAHDIEVRFFECGGGINLNATWSGQGGTPFPPTLISPWTGFTAYYYDFNRLLVTTTDANGNYSFGNLPAGVIWNVTPQFPTYEFSPGIAQPVAGQSGVNFNLFRSPPTISTIPNQTIPEDGSVTVSFSVFDWNTPLNSLHVTAVSGNAAVISPGDISFSGAGNSRTVTIRPFPNAVGSSTITINVTDGDGQVASTTFTVNVTPVNDVPVAGSMTALSLSGGGRAQAPAVDGLNTGKVPHTIEAWVRPAAGLAPGTRSWMLVLGQYGGGAHHWLFNPGSAANSLQLQFGAWGGAPQVADLEIPVAQWTHLAATWDPAVSNYTVFINGRVRAQTPPADNFNFSSTALALGLPPPGGELGFDGLVDEVRVWNRALSPTEILQNYNRPLTGLETGLRVYWRFDENQAITAADSAFTPVGNSTDGALTGAFAYAPGIFADPTYRTNLVNEDTATPLFLPAYDVEDWTRLTFQIVTPPTSGTLDRLSGNWNPASQNPVIYRPTNNYNGPDFFTYVVRDPEGATSAPATVYIRVAEANDLPTITSLPPLVIEEDTTSPPLPLTVGDAETLSTYLQLFGSSADTDLIKSSGIVFGGADSNRTVRITPVPGQLGQTTVLIEVVDPDQGSRSISFAVRVVPKPAYAVFDLGTVNSKQESHGSALNDSGWVAAYADTPSVTAPAAFLNRGFETEEPPKLLGSLGGPTSIALGINNAAQITGVSKNGSGEQRAFIWTDNGGAGVMAALSSVVGGVGSSASEGRAINGSGWVAGVATLNGQLRAALWSGAGVNGTNLGIFADGNRTEAFALNESGLVAGYGTIGTGAERALVHNGAGWSEVGLIAGHYGSRALAINNLGDVVGSSQPSANSLPRAFVRDSRGVRDLGLISGSQGAEARGINDFGQIVGESRMPSDERRAFFFSASRLYDLNELLTEDNGWVLQDARSINKDGWITGTGRGPDGKLRAYLAVPAWVVGKQIARPEGAYPRPPQIELLGDRGANTEQNSFYWSGVENKLYSIRPVKARMKWFTSAADVLQVGTNLVVNTNRIITVGAAIWPRVPTRHVASVPVEIEPQGVPFNYRWQTLEYVAGSGAAVDPNTKLFQAHSPGYTVIRYLETGADGVADPQVDKPVFDVVRTHLWNNPTVFGERGWFVGDTIINTNHFDYLGKNGHILFEKAFYDGTGPERAYDRVSRRGAIIPVNAATPTTSQAPYSFSPLVVAWYQTNRLGVAWGGQSVRYNLQWPATTTNKIIIARAIGSGPLPDALFPERRVYNQADPALPGFNPNEEHALLVPGESGEALFALRNDLNGPQDSPPNYSEPYALLKHRDSATGLWKVRVYKVVAEEAPWFFRYPGEAGREIQPPLPLTALPLCPESRAVAGPWWEDYQGKIYARAAGPIGDTTNVVIQWFYRLQPGFWYDLNGNNTNDLVDTTCIPWLDRLPGGSVGTPVNVTYNIRWPDRDDVLEVGQTLIKPRESAISGTLPEIKNQARAELVFDSLNFNDLNFVTNLARLYDPLTPRTIRDNVAIPDSIARRNIAGKEYFVDLPWALKQRLTFDPVNRWLSFAGYLDETFDLGEPLLLPNVMSNRERNRIKQLADGDSGWGRLIDRLYDLSRNPNRVDLDPADGATDQALRLGLVTQYTVRSNRTFVSTITGVETNVTTTNYSTELPTTRPAGVTLTVLATNIVPESFGSQPKALTAALGGVPAARPVPGNALRFDGVNDTLTTSNSIDLTARSFTIEFWARRTVTTGTNYIFSHNVANAAERLAIGFRFDGAFTFSFGGTALTAPPGLTDTAWHHWACTFNAVTNGRAIYRDGVLAASDVTPGAYAGGGRFVLGANASSNYFRGDVDEIRVWTAARSPFQISSQRNKRLKGVETDLLVYYRIDETNGTSVLDASTHGLNATIENGAVRVASSAPCGIPPRYVTLAFNNDPSLPGLPVTLKIIRIDDGPFLGDLKVLPGDNVFDQRLTFRHSSEFGGNPDGITFQWYYKFDSADFNPRALPVATAGSDQVTLNGWIPYSGYQPPTGTGVNDVTIGEGGESGLLVMSDTWWVCRYRGYNINLSTNEWSGWVGDPGGSAEEPRAKLAEGWVKRVLRGLNLFDQRVSDFHDNTVATYVNAIQQAGPRYVGDIAFNPSADNLNSIGLIEAYETVQRRARGLSIDGVPQVNFDPANNALLLAAGKIADFYMLLGNEAYGDAQDPTIGFGSSSTDYGTLSSSIYAFQNQLDSLLEEELALLRGRDDSRSGVSSYPVYNRLVWNFTLGEGEVAYKQVYNIKDVSGAQDSQGRPVADGFTDERDARVTYPQGHGDAWGHYLTAAGKYYELLRHPYFTWVPRTENVTVAGQALEVDFLDERKFARTASARAKTGKEIVDLTYRLNYTENPEGQWQGYKDTDPDRAWGVDEWARRAGMGAYFDWLTANTILPATDPNPNHTGIEKVDRTTVDELSEITSQMNEIQSRLDMADAGLNPLGLVKGAVVFDIDPTFNAVGSTAQIGRQAVQGLGHFEQIKERAVKTLNNAARIWDEANRSSQQLRMQQDSLDEFQRNYRDQEFDFKGRLIEIYGYPYAGDIGSGRTYPNGYDGPDLYRYMYVDVTEITGENSPPSQTFTGFFTRPRSGAGLGTNSFFLGFGPASLDPSTNGIMTVSYHLSAGSYGFASTPAMGKRRAQGELQFALSDLVQANAQLKIALQNYDGLIQDILAAIDLLEANYNVNASKIGIMESRRNTITGMNAAIGIFKAASITLRRVATVLRDYADAGSDGIPRVLGLANDVLSGARLAIKGTVFAIVAGLETGADAGQIIQESIELDKERVSLNGDISLQVEDNRFEVLQRVKELESMVRNEAAARLEAYNQAEVTRQAAQKYLSKLAEGQRVLEQLVQYRRNTAAEITERRYQDLTFRIFRNDAIQKYRAEFDLAARYSYLAATVYDYETSFLGPDPRAGRRFLNDLIKQRALGQLVDGNPAVGAPGLADSIARLEASFEVIRGQFGINNPQLETGHFGLRSELFRIRGHQAPDLGPDGIATTPDELAALAEADAANAISDPVWREQLRKFYVPNLWTVPEFRRYCRPFAPEITGPQPGLVIPFATTVSFGLNFFGWPLAGGDSAYDPTFFATKINAVGIQFDGYDSAGLSVTPRVYLIPVGMDVLRSPTSDTLATREWRIFDQALPVPFPIGNTDLGNANFIPINDTLSGAYGEMRRFASMRAYPTEAFAGLDDAQIAANTRLVGRSVWNTQWMLIIPGGTLLFDQNRGLDNFINSVTDIRLLLMTYSYSGN